MVHLPQAAWVWGSNTGKSCRMTSSLGTRGLVGMWGQVPCPSALGSFLVPQHLKIRKVNNGSDNPAKVVSIPRTPSSSPCPVPSISLRAAVLVGPLFPTHPVAHGAQPTFL